MTAADSATQGVSTDELTARLFEAQGRLIYDLFSPLEPYFPLAFIDSIAARVGLVVLVTVLVVLVLVRKQDLAVMASDGELPGESGSITSMRHETALSPIRRASISVMTLATMAGLLYLELTAALAAMTLLTAGLGYSGG